jgi:hypothetical protein
LNATQRTLPHLTHNMTAAQTETVSNNEGHNTTIMLLGHGSHVPDEPVELKPGAHRLQSTPALLCKQTMSPVTSWTWQLLLVGQI